MNIPVVYVCVLEFGIASKEKRSERQGGTGGFYSPLYTQRRIIQRGHGNTVVAVKGERIIRKKAAYRILGFIYYKSAFKTDVFRRIKVCFYIAVDSDILV